MGNKDNKSTTTIDIDSKVLAEFSYLVTVLEKPKKRNDMIEDMMTAYIKKNKSRV